MTARIISIVGARPQFIKAAAVSRAFVQTPEIEELLLHTGQHFDDNMSSVFFEELAIPEPRYNLDVHGGGHGEMTGRMLAAIEEVITKETPDAVLVYGDTNSTLAGALAAAKLHIPVIHVEAGLRSFNRRMPEEINRVVADHLSELLFCPTSQAVRNLAAEGITKGVHRTGDVMYDATVFAREAASERSRIVETLGLRAGEYALCTVHRAENTDDPDRLSRILDYLERQSADHEIVFPVHPRTRKLLDGTARKGLMLIDPVGYLDMHRLLSGAAQVFTDSGGLQKEAYFHRVPCVTLRDETEWVETVAAGWNRLWTDDDFAGPRTEISEYGTGDAAVRMIDELKRFLISR
jgi:UDP-GlcNAc3NAcA epimerase